MEKILVYLGPSLPLAEAKSILPAATYRPPAKQGDIVSDIVNFNPDYVILIDGEFRQNLSVWHKEIVYALQFPSVKAVYGAASMGALRAAELDWLGMVGIGKIYEWYRDSITEDDSEVALNYSAFAFKDYAPLTVPLVDIRAAVTDEAGKLFLEAVRQVSYGDRTPQRCQRIWEELGPGKFPCVPQKRLDAELTLREFRSYLPKPKQKPTPENLSPYFCALFDRDRRVRVKGVEIPQQHIDAYVILHNPEYERICWDSANQELALMLCDILYVTVAMEDIERESVRFQQKNGIKTQEDFQTFLENNGWCRLGFDQLMIKNARIRKLQHHLTVSKMYRRNTESIIDYLRTQGGFDYWAELAAKSEEKLWADDWLSLQLESPAWRQLLEHLESEGLELQANPEEYLLETGFSNLSELSVALQRVAAVKED